ncbi:PREDICTED: rubisco accumulation factor 1.1, chloroplastic [Ipomoea nil]|uniref:rubisco accumulation factor 1.1, chloroplastic n=1 Tax=Ipomoea nil TaxID=35883 RepID=UPI00090140A2|nr:PREDICTED: rubisco accumulation factor 1.1, chloroplastic [Ipomoea nil]
MLSLTLNTATPKPPSLTTAFLPSFHAPPSSSVFHKPIPSPRPISALIIPPSSSGQRLSSDQKQVYQPFRPPPSPLPSKFRNLDTSERLEVLSNRLGLWFEFAPLITSFIREGFTPSTLEEITGISGVEQNRIVVAAQVRDSLVHSEIDAETLDFFDRGGAELLYEIRILSAEQRVAAAGFLVGNNFDAKQSETLARAMKDFPMRRGDRGWAAFDANSPGDCLAFSYFRLALEYQSAAAEDLWRQSLHKGLEFVVSEAAKLLLEEELEGKAEVKEAVVDEVVTVPLVRMQRGELAESTVVVVLPVSKAEATEVEAAPWNCEGTGNFGIVEAEKEWRRWVVLPGWQPIAALERGGVAVTFKDGRTLPWRESQKNKSESILVVTDRQRKEVAVDEGFYLVAGGGGNGSVMEEELKVERGSKLKEKGVTESLGMVVLIVRPPREENDELSDEDWD